ncbi:TetR/AcrR family transcriptional regulator [Paraconexibacter antarcticus]|uniref:TetR/AcrR family transcriptional regulator n=1 Tax=Paraconexibacter antarcticus TaxID=2949664 RepID=A0ABY5DRV1_9ACTN|nr:TetR/AcrR family transcriptional regulator [Paraconexibacter antarcticus]UTI64406.1 TetR/AcrR family transcriptional regulator [Paraconexibacter antarcticus]
MSAQAPDPLLPRRRLPAPARRTRILAAALEAFASGGYGPTSMADIAQASGVTRAVLYDHFASKKAVFLAVVEQQNALFMGHVGARIAGEGTARERMRGTMDAVFRFAETHPHAWRLLFGNATHGDPGLDATWREIRAARVTAVAALLAADARAAGLDRSPAQVEIIVEMLVGALTGAVGWWREHPEATRADLVDAGTELLWTGLGRSA